MLDLAALDQRKLNEWIVAQRWFGSKARDVAQIEIMEAVPLRTEPPALVLAVVEARFPTGTHDTYQLPLGLRPADDGWDERGTTESVGWTVYDSLTPPAHG